MLANASICRYTVSERMVKIMANTVAVYARIDANVTYSHHLGWRLEVGASRSTGLAA